MKKILTVLFFVLVGSIAFSQNAEHFKATRVEGDAWTVTYRYSGIDAKTAMTIELIYICSNGMQNNYNWAQVAEIYTEKGLVNTLVVYYVDKPEGIAYNIQQTLEKLFGCTMNKLSNT